MFESAEVLQIFVAADERHGDRPLHEALVDACREHDLAGVTVFRNAEGFDDSSTITHEHWFRHEEPVAVMIVDRPECLDQFLNAVEPWITHGMLIRSSARVRRIQPTSGGH